ncbi:catalytic protein [Bisporella sp. PMI_857]|nr:catalytic protein [Bisporella sp. PMI_857]
MSATGQGSQVPSTIIIVQGSFQTPFVYKALEDRLKFLGYHTVHPLLPSCTNVDDPAFPSNTLTDDALAVRQELVSQIANGGKTVAVVMHSYGGLVGSEAIPENLTFNSRRARGLPGGVIHLYFFSAFILPPGQSVLDAFGESPNSDVRADGRFTIRNAGSVLYNDLPEDEAKLWESRLILQSYNVQKTKLTRAAYKYVSSTYLICENDQAAPAKYQEMFAASAGAQVERCKAGHSPMLSQTDLLADRISAAVERAINKEGKGL